MLRTEPEIVGLFRVVCVENLSEWLVYRNWRVLAFPTMITGIIIATEKEVAQVENFVKFGFPSLPFSFQWERKSSLTRWPQPTLDAATLSSSNQLQPVALSDHQMKRHLWYCRNIKLELRGLRANDAMTSMYIAKREKRVAVYAGVNCLHQLRGVGIMPDVANPLQLQPFALSDLQVKQQYSKCYPRTSVTSEIDRSIADLRLSR